MSYRSRLVVGPGDSSSLPVPDYNQEARNLWARLGIDPSDKPSPGPGRLGGRYNSLDVIFRSPQGGYIYVGDNQAASDLQLLRQNGISAVVNCTMDLPNYHTGQLKYYNFDVTWWKRQASWTGLMFLKNVVYVILVRSAFSRVTATNCTPTGTI